MAQQERAVRTKEAVLVAAGEAFAEYGFLGTSMADIFARAGVTKGALYFHYSSKEDLAFAVIEAEEESAAEIAGKILSSDSPPIQKLIDISFRWALEIQTNPVVRAGVRLIIEQGTYSRPMPRPYMQWQEMNTALLTEARDRNELATGVDIKGLAELMVAAFTGAQIISQTASGHSDLVDRVERMWRVLLPIMVPPGGPIVFLPRMMR